MDKIDTSGFCCCLLASFPSFLITEYSVMLLPIQLHHTSDSKCFIHYSFLNDQIPTQSGLSKKDIY